MVFYHTVGSDLILDGFICGGNHAAGNEKYTKWPTLYGDTCPPAITFCHTTVCTHNPHPGEVGGNMGIINRNVDRKSRSRILLVGQLWVYYLG